MAFPNSRGRRLRRSEAIRDMVQETQLEPRTFIAPLFVKEGLSTPQPIPSLPGQFHHTLGSLRREVGELIELGVRGIILFGIPATKDAAGTQAWSSSGIVQLALTQLRDEFGDHVVLIGDLCLCEYTDHGHCGILSEISGRTSVDNDRTLELYGQIALSQAASGVDFVGPSGMMDGQVGAIRRALDDGGYPYVGILAYSAKFASSFYGPFREAAESTPQFSDRKDYQMASPNAQEALREIEQDVAEGADIIMVKPALPYLDIVRAARERFGMPTAAYNVSGEFAMVHAAAERGWLDLESAMMEMLVSIKRAGADLILTYFAKDAAHHLRE